MKVVVILLTLTLVGCATSKMWENQYYETSTYQETLHQFLITEDNKQLILIGEKFHYIFNEANTLNTLLLSENRHLLSADLDNRNFFSRDNKVRVFFNIKCDGNNATKQQIDWLIENGFKREKQPPQNFNFSKTINIKGEKYLSNGLLSTETNTFNKKYNIEVTEYTKSSGVVAKTAMTPLMLTAEGLAYLTYGTFILLASPIIIAEELENTSND